jgi:hypothetical protein
VTYNYGRVTYDQYIELSMQIQNKNKTTDPVKEWLMERFFYRNLFKGANGKPLYSYQLSQDEFNELLQLLLVNNYQANYSVLSEAWCACFCLFVSECYRREYDQNWKWVIFERRIQCDFTQQQHAEIVEKGLKFWKRPVRFRENGRDLLGSLFAEGGLPWPLVQDATHGFGKAIRQGLKFFYRTKNCHRTTTDLMSDFEKDLPKSFQTIETQQLLAGIVEQLMYLVEHFPLKDQADPAAYLDLNDPDWRSSFPIPLDESNARNLINEWLTDAGRRRQQIKAAESKALDFSCIHTLLGKLPTWHIRTIITLPKKSIFKIDINTLNSTRLELGFYEGECLLAKGGAIYAQIFEDSISVRFPNTQITLDRRNFEAPLSLQLLDFGHSVHMIPIENSSVDYHEQPLIFEPIGDQWCFAADASAKLANTKARFRLPASFTVVAGEVTELAVEENGSHWFEADESLIFKNQDDVFSLQLNQSKFLQKPSLVGNNALYDSQPTCIYIGWPRLDIPEEYNQNDECLTQFIGDLTINTVKENKRIGLIKYAVKNSNGEILLRRSFGVLPKDFSLSLYPAFNNSLAQLKIRNGQDLRFEIINQELNIKTIQDEEATIVFFNPRKGYVLPTTFELQITSIYSSESIKLWLPYPCQGARLISGDGGLLKESEIILDDLIGLRIALSSGMKQERFYLKMELISKSAHRLRKLYVIEVGDAPLMLNLFSYQNDIAQMLGAVSDQDAYIGFTVETSQRLLTLNIKRYGGNIHWENMQFTVSDINQSNQKSSVKVAAMLLSDPKQIAISIPEKTSEGIGTGWFEVMPFMDKKSPWLIYPDNDSKILFRPVLWAPVDSTNEIAVSDIHSLNQATKLYHPQKYPHVIDDQITLMAKDFDHNGWQYLADLKLHFSHLPLSSFESWLSLSRNPEALVTAVFKLEIDEIFCARISDELAVIWECIPLHLWVQMYADYVEWLQRSGIPDVLKISILNNRKLVLPEVVSGFSDMGDFLESGDISKLKIIDPIYLLPDWYQDIRRNHNANQNWPTELGKELSIWIHKQSLPDSIKDLSQVHFTHAVTYMPIFMAYVTAGKATLDDLPVDQILLKFVIKMVSDFDRSGWYTPVHTLLVSYLLAADSNV